MTLKEKPFESIVEKGRNASNQHFLLFPQYLLPFPNSNFSVWFIFYLQIFQSGSRAGGLVVSMSDSRPGGCEFYIKLRWTFFLAYFGFSPLRHVRKIVGVLEKKLC